MIENNTNLPLSILFMFYIEKDAMQTYQMRRVIKPNDVFKIPLKWYMNRNMYVDVYLIKDIQSGH